MASQPQSGPFRPAQIHDPSSSSSPARIAHSVGLRRLEPYWYEFETQVKMRWIGRMFIEVLVTEFRDRTRQFYTWAIHKGLARINGQTVDPTYRLKDGDVLTNRVHRHEPPVTLEPVRLLHHQPEEGRLVVVKPGGMPIHAAGRYFHHTLIEMIKSDLHVPRVLTSNRLDRLTSGIMVCSTTSKAASKLASDFEMGLVRKAYICRVSGKFPEEEVVCKEPLLPIDRQTGVSVVHPTGKPCHTIFNRMSYDEETNTSVVFCQPITGRTHQIRVHVQILGFPIVNDPIYNHPIWKELPPSSFAALQEEEDRGQRVGDQALPCEETDRLVEALKAAKDDGEDWARLKDEIRFGALNEEAGYEVLDIAGPNGESSLDQLRREVGEDKMPSMEELAQGSFCDECMTPINPEPSPESLYIYLHAIKYETDEWSFADKLPWWAKPDWRASPAAGVAASKAGEGSMIVEGEQAGKDELPPLRRALEGPPGWEEAMKQTQGTPLALLDPVPEACEKPSGRRAAQVDDVTAPITFGVFRGLEDFAVTEMRSVLSRRGHSDLATESSVLSGHVVIPSSPSGNSSKALQAHNDGALWSVRDAFALAARVDLPLDMTSTLQEERLGLVKYSGKKPRQASKKERQRAVDEGKDLATLEAELAPPEPKDDTVFVEHEELGRMTSTEAAFLERLAKAWRDELERGVRVAFEDWRKARLALGLEAPTLGEGGRFRTRVQRSLYLLPFLTSMQLERYFGGLCWAWLNPGRQKGDTDLTWRVDLDEPDLELVVHLVPGLGTGAGVPWSASNPAGSALFMFTLPSPRTDELVSHRPTLDPALTAGGTALKRYRAQTLALALPIPLDLIASDLTRPLQILEPCAGTGSLAVEVGAALRRRGIRANIFASDSDANCTERMPKLVRRCGFRGREEGEEREQVVTIDTQRVNARNKEEVLAVVGGPEKADLIITDLPWGRREESHSAITKLYPGFLSSFLSVLRPGGYALLMTAECKLMLRLLRSEEGNARKFGEGWYLRTERLWIEEGRGKAEGQEKEGETDLVTQGRLGAESLNGTRYVDVGYLVYVFLLRKVPIS